MRITVVKFIIMSDKTEVFVGIDTVIPTYSELLQAIIEMVKNSIHTDPLMHAEWLRVLKLFENHCTDLMPGSKYTEFGYESVFTREFSVEYTSVEVVKLIQTT